MTQPGHEPSKDWLAFVKTSRARNKIKHVINASERVKAIEIGQKYLEKEARRLGVQLSKVTKADMERVAGGVRAQQDGRPARGARLRQVLRAPGAVKIAPGVVKEEAAGARGPRRAPDSARRTPRRARGAPMATASSRSAASTT